MQRVAIVGAAGKMGTAATAAVLGAADLELAAVIDPTEIPPPRGATWLPEIAALDARAVDVVVDLSSAAAARATMAWTATGGGCCVIGTSGLTDADLDAVRDAAGASGATILVVPNFSIGAVLLQRFAAEAAPYFTGVEVIELHHDLKRDAPSGTSISTASAIAASRAAAGADALVDPTTSATLADARGAEGPGAIRIHSVRLPGLLAHQEVHFGAPGEGLVLRHDSYDRSSFMAGLLVAIRRAGTLDGVVVGLDAVLDR